VQGRVEAFKQFIAWFFGPRGTRRRGHLGEQDLKREQILSSSVAKPRALGRPVGDEFIVPLCRAHHRHCVCGPKYRVYLGFLWTPIYPLVYSQTRIFVPSYDCCVASRTTSLATPKGNTNASSLSDRGPAADWQAAAANNVDLTRRGYAA
jgi:hypothetical protein